MYMPSQFEELRTEAMHALMREHPLAALVTQDGCGLEANHLPFELDAEAGILHAHVARNNPVWRSFAGMAEGLAIFQGPSAYISPSWYATKRKHGRVVPTYNYAVVHAYGRLQAIEDPVAVRAMLERLSARFEAGRAQPWSLGDAPEDYLQKLLPQIVGIEMRITRLQGKWKVSQNQPSANRIGVIQGLRAETGESASAMADAVARYGRSGAAAAD